MSVIEINHPLIEHKMTILRSVDTDTKSFRENLNEIAKLMTYEATKIKIRGNRSNYTIDENTSIYFTR